MTTQDAESVKPTGLYSELKNLFKKSIGAIRGFFNPVISFDVHGRALTVVDWVEIICIGISVILLGAIVFLLIVAYFVFILALIFLLFLFCNFIGIEYSPYCDMDDRFDIWSKHRLARAVYLPLSVKLRCFGYY